MYVFFNSEIVYFNFRDSLLRNENEAVKSCTISISESAWPFISINLCFVELWIYFIAVVTSWRIVVLNT